MIWSTGFFIRNSLMSFKWSAPAAPTRWCDCASSLRRIGNSIQSSSNVISSSVFFISFFSPFIIPLFPAKSSERRARRVCLFPALLPQKSRRESFRGGFYCNRYFYPRFFCFMRKVNSKSPSHLCKLPFLRFFVIL